MGGQHTAFQKVKAANSMQQITCMDKVVFCRWDDGGGDCFHHLARLSQHPAPPMSAVFLNSCCIKAHALRDMSAMTEDVPATEGGKKALVLQLGLLHVPPIGQTLTGEPR